MLTPSSTWAAPTNPLPPTQPPGTAWAASSNSQAAGQKARFRKRSICSRAAQEHMFRGAPSGWQTMLRVSPGMMSSSGRLNCCTSSFRPGWSSFGAHGSREVK